MAWFRKSTPPGPDYAAVDSPEKARRLVEKGELVALLLLPEALGGENRAENVVYVPPFAAELKARADRNIILPQAADGRFTHYRAQPQYAGRSVVPVAIRLSASDPGSFSLDIAIWGVAPAP